MAQFRKDTHQYLKDGKTVFEVVMLADQYGNLVGPANPSGMSVDAFGRSRVGLPYTLLDSFHRFGDNGKIATSNTAGGTYSFNANTSSIDCSLTTASGAKVYRESKRVFAYQPGKSLQILTTFVMSPHKTNLRQRIGYFGAENGFFLERSDATASKVCFVKRTKVSGVVQDIQVDQADWNVDKLDGTGPSLITLNLDDPQIFFTDVEWLGVGTARMGFVINGQFIHCHSFHHANMDAASKGAYMQTACLPLRLEVENIGTTSSNSLYKQICASVVSEGGIEPSGRQRTIGQDPVSSNTIVLTTAGTYYPVVSIKLHPDRMDAIVLPKEIALLPLNQANYRWKIITDATINGAVWTNTHSDSSIQWNTNTAATMSDGTEIESGFLTSTVQAGGTINLGDALFKYQLERDSFANTQSTFTLAVTSGTATSNVAGSITWQEIT